MVKLIMGCSFRGISLFFFFLLVVIIVGSRSALREKYVKNLMEYSINKEKKHIFAVGVCV